MNTKRKKLINVIAREFNVPNDFVDIKLRSKRITDPKKVLSYFLYYKEELTLKEVAAAVGYKEHATVIYNLKCVDIMCVYDYFKAKIDRIAEEAYKIYILNK